MECFIGVIRPADDSHSKSIGGTDIALPSDGRCAMQAAAELRDPFKWPVDGVVRAPYRLFSDPDIYELEQAQIFRGQVWSFL